MKKLFTSIIIAMASLSTMTAQNNPLEEITTNPMHNVVNNLGIHAARGVKKAMPVYNDELITEAPEGTVVSGLQRSGYSYFYTNGNLNGGYNDGFVGEYVLGNDSCIYIKEACASLTAGSYLKLEKIDDENYVAHTAQLAWVYEGSSSPTPYFATRLVLKIYGENQYGYVMETDENGKELCDVYFTYKDGVLQQKSQTVSDLNGQLLPNELIGLTNATGGWIGYGDGCLTFKPTGYEINKLPEGAVVKEGSFAYSTMSSTIGKNITNAQLTKFAEVGDEFFVQNPVDGKNWIKGQIDRTANTVTFLPQYIGVNESINCHQWFAPATYNDWHDIWDEEEGTGTWVRDLKSADKYVCKYENGGIVSDPESKQTFVISLSAEALQTSGAYSLINIKPYEPKLAKPAQPILLKFSPVEDTFFWGEIIFAMSPVDENGVYINKEELYYNIYLNSTTPFTFTNDEFEKVPAEGMTDVPFMYDDDHEFDCNGAFHNIYFYTGGIKFMGIQAIHKKDGQEMRSEITWWGDPTAISSLSADEVSATPVKMLKNNRIIIVKNGVKYNVNGQIVK